MSNKNIDKIKLYVFILQETLARAFITLKVTVKVNQHYRFEIHKICRSLLFLHLLLPLLILFFPLWFQRGIICALHLELCSLDR